MKTKLKGRSTKTEPRGGPRSPWPGFFTVATSATCSKVTSSAAFPALLSVVIALFCACELRAVDPTPPPSPSSEFKVGSDGNMILNHDFSNGRNSWEQNGEGQHTILAGNEMLYLQNEGYFAAYQDLEIPSTGVYLFEVIVHNQGQRGAQAIIIPFVDGAFDGQKNTYLVAEGDDKWQRVSKQVDIGANVSKVRIALVGMSMGAWFKAVYFGVSHKRPVAEIPKVEGSISINGLPDESAWQKALQLKDFRVLGRPKEIAVPETTARVFYNDDHLYIAYQAQEPSPGNMNVVEKNAVVIYGGDDVETFISPNREEFFQFLVGPKGHHAAIRKLKSAKTIRKLWYHDLLQGESLTDFDGDWEAAGKTGSNAYTVEMKIALKDIFKNSQEAEKGALYINFCRHRTQGEIPYSNWSGLAGNTFHAPQNFPEFKIAWRGTARESPVATFAEKPSELSHVTHPLSVPGRLMAGVPLKQEILTNVYFEVPAELRFQEEGVLIDGGVKELIKRGVVDTTGKGMATIAVSLLGKDEPPPLALDEPHRVLYNTSPEAFVLNIAPQTISIRGRAREGVLRGLATAALLVSQAKSSKDKRLKGMTIVDAPRIGVRGWDAGGIRTPEGIKQLLDIWFLLRLNHLVFEASTYGNEAEFPFESHPDIGSTLHTKQQYKELAEYARVRGITIVPLFYSWSRAGYILNKERYKHLAAGKNPNDPAHLHDRTFNAWHPETKKLLFDLYDELIDTMSIDALNIGLDEAHYDTMVDPLNEYSKGKSPRDWMAYAVTETKKHLDKKNVALWIFADLLSPYHSGGVIGINEPEDIGKLNVFPKDIYVLPWNYDPPKSEGYIAIPFLKKAGFKVIGTPSWYTAQNVPAMARDVFACKAEGMIGTTWGSPIPETPYVQIFTGVSLLAYMTWSPEYADIDAFPFIPDYLYKYVAFQYGKESSFLNGSVTWSNPVAQTPGQINKGELHERMGFPVNVTLDFLTRSYTNNRGVKILPFAANSEIAAYGVRGGKNESVTLPVATKAHELTFFHAVSKLYDYEQQALQLNPYYKGAEAGAYDIRYANGQTEVIRLAFRREASDWNDCVVPARCDPLIFGSMKRQVHLNLPTYTWKNPHPDQTIESITMRSGNREKMDLFLLGLSGGSH
jgi:hypothetical protein